MLIVANTYMYMCACMYIMIVSTSIVKYLCSSIIIRTSISEIL